MDTDKPPSNSRPTKALTKAKSHNLHPWYHRFLDWLIHSMILRPKSRNELLDVLRDAQKRQVLDHEAQSMLEGVLSVADMRVREIMIPRSQMNVVERDAPTDSLLKSVVETGHSRFPVIGDSRDEVIGVLLAKDVLSQIVSYGSDKFDVREVTRPAVFVPESKRLNVLLWEFRSSQNHIAIVVDEYGGVSGLVTIEDVLEQIVGEIDDEHDLDSSPDIVKHYGERYSVKALTPLSDFNDTFGTELSDENIDTIGGYIVKQFSYVPRRGDKVILGDLQVKVLKADGRRVHQLEVKPAEDLKAVDQSAETTDTDEHEAA